MSGCGTTTGYRKGCRCKDCRNAHRIDAKERRWRRNGPPIPMTPEERFWAKVIKTPTCWIWNGAHDGSGYGFIKIKGKNERAHRFAYELLVGPIPEGMVIDHLCRVRSCCNPEHLEPVTHQENMARARWTHCSRGHEFTPENERWVRTCRKCEEVRRDQRRAAA